MQLKKHSPSAFKALKEIRKEITVTHNFLPPKKRKKK